MMFKVVSHSTAAIRQMSLISTKPMTLPTATTVKNYLDEKQFNYVEGHASYMLECPICDATVKQQNKAPQYCMYVNKTTGSVKCPPCKLSGRYSVHVYGTLCVRVFMHVYICGREGNIAYCVVLVDHRGSISLLYYSYT